MKVRATAPGVHTVMRNVGDVFDIADEPKQADGTPKAFSHKWMEKVPEKAQPKADPIQQPVVIPKSKTEALPQAEPHARHKPTGRDHK